MRQTLLAIAAAIGLTATGFAIDRANAMPLNNGVSGAADEIGVLDQVQYWGGRRYCWYDDGWNGPGWYWCGRYLVPGLGWGGGVGWRGWGGRGGRGIGPGFRGIRGIGPGPRGIGPGPRGIGPGPRGIGPGPRGIGPGPRGIGPGPRGIGPGPRGVGPGPRGVGPGPRGARSDVTLKHDIAILGHLDNGLGFYRFSYNGSDKAYVGVMAQEVQTVMPQAVARGSDGYLRVYYDKLGVKFETYEQWVASGSRIPSGATIRH